MTDSYVDHGMQIGPVKVVNMANIRGTRIIWLKTDKHVLEIAVSPKGNNVRVFQNGVRLTEGEGT